MTNSISTNPTIQKTPKSSSAIVSIISGVLAWLGLFGLGGILAVIFGHIAKNEIKKSGGQLSGDELATIGLVLGYANIAVSVIGFCFLLMLLTGLIAMPIFLTPLFSNSGPSAFLVF